MREMGQIGVVGAGTMGHGIAQVAAVGCLGRESGRGLHTHGDGRQLTFHPQRGHL